jgi:signal transduction histidine kinase
MSVSLRCAPDLRLPRALEVQVYILVAEAVAHAADVCGATRADVELTLMGTGLVVRVVSDACPPQEQGDEGRLVAMTECVTLLAGTLTVTCSPVGMGTTVRAVLPVPPRTE